MRGGTGWLCVVVFSCVKAAFRKKCCRYFEAIVSLIGPVVTLLQIWWKHKQDCQETFSSWDVFHWLHNCLNIWFGKSVMILTCSCLQVVYITFRVHRLLACQYMLISSKCKIQLRLIGMSLVLQVFGQIKRSDTMMAPQCNVKRWSKLVGFILWAPWVFALHFMAIHPIFVEIFWERVTSLYTNKSQFATLRGISGARSELADRGITVGSNNWTHF